MAKEQQQLRLFEETPVQYAMREGEPWVASEELGRQLGYANPRINISKLYRKHEDELSMHSVVAKSVTTDGKSYETRLFDEEGVYLMSMFARTKNSKKFRALFARTMRELRQHHLELARQAGQAEALDAVVQLTQGQYAMLPQVLRYREMGLNAVEIGKILGCHEETVRKTLRKLRGVAA